MAELLKVDVEAWLGELPSIRKHFDRFGAKLPSALGQELGALEKRLQAGTVAAEA